MAIPTETRTLNTLFATTAYATADAASVNTLTSFPLVNRLYKNGRYKKRSGGARIQFGVRYGLNPGTQWFQGADVLDMTPFESNTAAIYDWKNLHAPLTYTGSEERMNSGAAQILDLVSEKLAATQTTLNKVLDIAMCGDGTAFNGKVILGLDALVSTTPTVDPAAGLVGNITAVGNPWWQNYAVGSFGSFAANGPKGTASDLWINTWDTISDGSSGPDFILSAQDVYEMYHRQALGAVQLIMEPNATGRLSFPKLDYMGAPWYWDRNILSGKAYMLRDDDFEFGVHTSANMTLSPIQKSINQDLYGASMLLMCYLAINRRMFAGVISGITA